MVIWLESQLKNVRYRGLRKLVLIGVAYISGTLRAVADSRIK